MGNNNSELAPIFVVGVGRSGTTLLVNLLGCDPLIAPIYETSFLKNLLSLCRWASWFWGRSVSRRASRALPGYVGHLFQVKCERYKLKCDEFKRIHERSSNQAGRGLQGKRQQYESFPFQAQRILFPMADLIKEADQLTSALQARPLTDAEIYGLARASLNRLFESHCAVAGKPYWVNKTPRLLLCLDLLGSLYPNAKCLHIVRDGRDVAASFRTLSWGPKNIAAAARRWKNRLSARKRADSAPLQYTEVHYEDLIRSPEETFGEVLKFLELQTSSADILKQFNLYDHRVGAWRDILQPEEKRIFDREAGDLLIELGYEQDHSWAR
jgi:hypothetical protein